MQPHISVSAIAIVVSVVASFLLGGIWYGALFGKVWRKAMGFAGDARPSGADFARGAVINIVGLALMAFFLSREIGIRRPSSWGVGADAAPTEYAFLTALALWLGFVIPILLNGVGYERKGWTVFILGAAYQLLSLVVMALILSFWH
jgi:hypothetical protein